jgi:hypothetical protein
MRTHRLKTWPGPFQAVLDGRKRFEVRKDDRGFDVGDELFLREWEPDGTFTGYYTDRSVLVRVTYLLEGERWGIERGFVVMGIELDATGDAA